MLLLARHGETPDNEAELILGRRDPPLSARGREQATQLASRAVAAGILAIWTSPLLRARQTAAVVAVAVAVEPIVLAELIESERGAWEGQSQRQIAAESPDLFKAFEAADPDFVFPDGESLRSQVQRTSSALTIIAARRQPALVVAHAGTIQAALIAIGRRPPPESALAHGKLIPLPWSPGAGGTWPAGAGEQT
ncbi:MAG: histidine phosphatase family protein [Solirubrobacterales bacterium]|nr:histidine phosphatase family protein [Solirubrobacterales bacterium]